MNLQAPRPTPRVAGMGPGRVVEKEAEARMQLFYPQGRYPK